MDKNKLPNRKLQRLKSYDYSKCGAYFVTICTREHKQLLSDIIVGRADPELPIEECAVFDKLILTRIGTITENYLLQIEHHYDHVKLIKYVIMPNHIHLILLFDYNGRQGSAFPTDVHKNSLCNIIKAFKTLVHKKVGFKIFQSSFHDHIIRNEKEYEMIWNYIEHNPQNWFNDRYNPDTSKSD